VADAPGRAVPPRLFDGDALPALADAPDFLALSTKDRTGERGPVALLGETIDVQARSARMWLPRMPGRNLAVLGTRIDEACAVLGTAARSLARQHGPGQARFSIGCLDPDARGAAQALHAELPPAPDGTTRKACPSCSPRSPRAGRHRRPMGRPHYLVLYAVDAASSRLAVKTPIAGKPIGPSGHDHLRRILHSGPERHIHLLGWWRGVARLRDDLGGPGAARFDSIGAWVALDVHGAELVPSLHPGPSGPPWYPRPWRALYFDRAIHRTAEVIIPYGLP